MWLSKSHLECDCFGREQTSVDRKDHLTEAENIFSSRGGAPRLHLFASSFSIHQSSLIPPVHWTQVDGSRFSCLHPSALVLKVSSQPPSRRVVGGAKRVDYPSFAVNE